MEIPGTYVYDYRTAFKDDDGRIAQRIQRRPGTWDGSRHGTSGLGEALRHAFM
jgi:hypothetical protein